MKQAHLCLGGNLGNPVAVFDSATHALQSHDIATKCKSGIYRSEAWGMENAPDFLNQVIEVETRLSAADLMHTLLEVEHRLGRERTYADKYESRIIDIDILLFDNSIIDSEHLHIPHPRMHLRRFVLEPLAEIAPDLIHPVLHKTIAQLLKDCPDKGRIEKIPYVA
jgi:2-amino-4-hydroxy-6-hydroxymethyldihydropteridine diphosphokinase